MSIDKNDYSRQNACLMLTTNDENGGSYLTYIPLYIGQDEFDKVIKNIGSNNKVIDFILGMDPKEYWGSLWEKLLNENNYKKE